MNMSLPQIMSHKYHQLKPTSTHEVAAAISRTIPSALYKAVLKIIWPSLNLTSQKVVLLVSPRQNVCNLCPLNIQCSQVTWPIPNLQERKLGHKVHQRQDLNHLRGSQAEGRPQLKEKASPRPCKYSDRLLSWVVLLKTCSIHC